MDILQINNYINIAKAQLMDDPEFINFHEDLEKEREVLNKMGYDPEKIINILYVIWCQRIGYILDNKDEMDKMIDYASYMEDFTIENQEENDT
ncbi:MULTISPECIES: hypothetical protein [unclassified Butyrivibrio]|uniref:hypothetical protein n=1 Tax=unclassified Butyrivibrio TaxID=2639466 RepID=UPI0003FA28CC|nr:MULTISPECIES: hypothetical protein [unclassified Butyrivibrio]